jgi:hemerythrin
MTVNVDFEWHDEYSIGVDEVDVQHRRFLTLLKEIYEVSAQTTERRDVSRLLDELMRYVRFHLGSEELLMEAYAYPKHLEQKSEHAQLIKELERQVDEIRSNRGHVNSLLFHLMKWFVNHDSHADQEFGDYVKKHRRSSRAI